MKVEIFTICDAATADSSGKLNILGAYDTLYYPTMPQTLPVFALAAKIRLEANEAGQKGFRISMIDADGKPVIATFESRVNIQFAQNQIGGAVQLVLLIPQLKLPSFGEYSVQLAVGDISLAQAPLYVRQRTDQPPGQIQFLPPRPAV